MTAGQDEGDAAGGLTRACTGASGRAGERPCRWGIPDPSKLARLAITHPTFVANGDADLMMITQNSHLLADHPPNAQLRIYPDAGHGFHDQSPEQFADHVRAFLNGG